MFKKKHLLIAFSLSAVVLTVLAFRFVPVAKVDGRFVSYSQFMKFYTAHGTYNTVARGGADEQEITKRTLQDLVETILLENLVRKVDRSLEDKAHEAMERAILETKGLALSEASRRLYGLSAADFKSIVLLPQAKKDALVDALASQPGKLDELWAGLIKTADIKIYYPGYKWENGGVKIK